MRQHPRAHRGAEGLWGRVGVGWGQEAHRVYVPFLAASTELPQGQHRAAAACIPTHPKERQRRNEAPVASGVRPRHKQQRHRQHLAHDALGQHRLLQRACVVAVGAVQQQQT